MRTNWFFMVLILLLFNGVISENTSLPNEKVCVEKVLIQELISKNVELAEKLARLESDMNHVKHALSLQEELNNVQENKIKDLEHLLQNTKDELPTPEESDGNEKANVMVGGESSPGQPAGRVKIINSNRITRQEAEHIAFSAYDDHEVPHMGKDQTVQFQNVLLNDGNAYNKHTSIFTVPRDGVYLLSFFVEDYHRFQSIFHMTVDRRIVTGAIADPVQWGQNEQGGNVIVIRLNAGDSVWVTAAVAGDDIEGYGLLRTSTFSGCLLYP